MTVSYINPPHDAECIANCGKPMTQQNALAIMRTNHKGIWWAHREVCYAIYLEAHRIIHGIRKAHAA